ncbi:hypothetical protein AYO21_07922 [Fonsecaea monophora]|uniref:Uncharacterized protein n=1 Tax=Fonsecaea monophora TaxID=254056 RepID=A0A177F1X1_9EURO|nr:hypothetical protein AYO21_07922 [Fonsecaea monophora]KAH0843784.1 proteinase [Fonsecaea pedrosoi]OAG37816.1 hypothetical protein AYO21_07922 [Fonsecaea monophora]
MSSRLALTVLSVSAAVGVLAQGGGQTGIQFQPCPELNANISALLGGGGSVFDCATLSVPLDYTDPDSGPLDLRLFRVNATQEPVLGSVLINFGGPGGTGAENLPTVAEIAQSVIGPQWNLVSWDPRGTGYTLPFTCDLDALAAAPAPAQKRDVGTLISTNVTEVFLNVGWDYAGQIADYCAGQSNETGTLIGTAFTARDMIEIVDALDEDGLLRYYGWSYGTALGSYVAAMFPDRVERMVLDGNLNPHDYQAGHYGEFAHDIDEAFAGFLQTCFDTADNCALYSLLRPNTTQDLLDAINAVLIPLAENATSSLEGYLTYLGVKGTFIEPLYYPSTWPTFAETLASIMNGTASAPANTSTPVPYGLAKYAVIRIRASDATFIANSSDDYLSQVKYQATVSPGFSDASYFNIWPSARWRMHARERYWGDFRATTKSPILYVNGEFDPVTPLVNAYNGSAGFTGSAVLPHSGYGHGVFVSPSACVSRHVQAYFLNGTLPEADAHCEPDLDPVELWLSRVQASEANSTASGNDTDDGSGNGNATANASENGASRENSRTVYTTVGMLAIAALILL